MVLPEMFNWLLFCLALVLMGVLLIDLAQQLRRQNECR
jgi:hypothetical protein